MRRRLEWVAFVVAQGFAVNHTSKVCSRHFIPGSDYPVGNAHRRRLLHTAVPSLVSMNFIMVDLNTLSLLLLCTPISLM